TSSATASPSATAARSPPSTERRAGSKRSRSKTASVSHSPSSSSFSAHNHARNGSTTPSHAPPTASSSPATQPAPTACSRQACPASSPLATSAPDPANAAPPPSAKDRWPCSSSTRTSQYSELGWDERALHPPRRGRAARAARVRRRLRGVPARRRQVAAPTDLSHVRSRRLLRRLPQPPRDRSPSGDLALDHPLARTWRGLELVLPRRGRIRPRRPSRHDAYPTLAAPELSPKAMTPYGVQAASPTSLPACGTPCAGGTRPAPFCSPLRPSARPLSGPRPFALGRRPT